MAIKPSSSVEVAPGASLGFGRQLVAFVEILLLVVWLGSMMFFSFAVAPSAFKVLPTRELAGALVTSTISKVEVLGLAIGPLLLLIQAVSRPKRRSRSTINGLPLILLAAMTGAAALSHFWISPKMVSLRAAMGGQIDDVPASYPLRVQFNDLHQYSVGLMSAAMISGLVVLFLTVRSRLKR